MKYAGLVYAGVGDMYHIHPPDGLKGNFKRATGYLTERGLSNLFIHQMYATDAEELEDMRVRLWSMLNRVSFIWMNAYVEDIDPFDFIVRSVASMSLARFTTV